MISFTNDLDSMLHNENKMLQCQMECIPKLNGEKQELGLKPIKKCRDVSATSLTSKL
jgi:hypothetical protein